ncbi:MAG: hypothetical protein ACTHJ3_05890 [Pararhizobium sp.]
MLARYLTRSLFTGVFVVSLAGSAFALDGNRFLDTLNKAYAGSGARIVSPKIDVNGDTIVLHDATVEVPGEPKMPGTDLTFSGVAETPGGGYTARALTIPDIDYHRDGSSISIKTIEADGITIEPASGTAGSALFLYDSAHTGPVSIANKDGEIAAAAGVTSTVDALPDGKGYRTSLTVDGLTLHLDRMKDARFRKAVEAMGYQTVTGTLGIKGMWETGDGRIEVSQFALDLNDVGRLGLTLDLKGYTPAFVQSLRELQAKAAANPEDKQTQQALGIGLLGLMQQLSFGGASIRFDDHSLTHKVLDYVAKQQGVTDAQVAMAAKAMLPLALAKLRNQEFEQQISDAVGAFLDQPKSIEIKAAPEKPVPFPMILGAAMAAPQTLPDVLSATVTANR